MPREKKLWLSPVFPCNPFTVLPIMTQSQSTKLKVITFLQPQQGLTRQVPQALLTPAPSLATEVASAQKLRAEVSSFQVE